VKDIEHIVIIDDSKFMLKVMSKILSPYYEVHCFDKPKEAIEKIPEIDPALILLDVIMPEMNGFEAIKVIKSKRELAEIPVIMITATQDDDDGANEVKCFMLGAVDFVNKPLRPQVVLARVRSHVDLYEFRRELGKTAVTDALTGIYNRRGFDDALKRECCRSSRENTVLSLCLLDIDCFKFYNDNYGHQAGDNALHLVGQAIKKSLHRMTDVAARYGGEEFALILPGVDEEGAATVAAAVNQAIMDLNITHEFSAADAKVVTVSIGVVTSTAVSDGADLIKAADEMLYKAKESGRNRFCTTTI